MVQPGRLLVVLAIAEVAVVSNGQTRQTGSAAASGHNIVSTRAARRPLLPSSPLESLRSRHARVAQAGSAASPASLWKVATRRGAQLEGQSVATGSFAASNSVRPAREPAYYVRQKARPTSRGAPQRTTAHPHDAHAKQAHEVGPGGAEDDSMQHSGWHSAQRSIVAPRDAQDGLRDNGWDKGFGPGQLKRTHPGPCPEAHAWKQPASCEVGTLAGASSASVEALERAGPVKATCMDVKYILKNTDKERDSHMPTLAVLGTSSSTLVAAWQGAATREKMKLAQLKEDTEKELNALRDEIQELKDKNAEVQKERDDLAKEVARLKGEDVGRKVERSSSMHRIPSSDRLSKRAKTGGDFANSPTCSPNGRNNSSNDLLKREVAA